MIVPLSCASVPTLQVPAQDRPGSILSLLPMPPPFSTNHFLCATQFKSQRGKESELAAVVHSAVAIAKNLPSLQSPERCQLYTTDLIAIQLIGYHTKHLLPEKESACKIW